MAIACVLGPKVPFKLLSNLTFNSILLPEKTDKIQHCENEYSNSKRKTKNNSDFDFEQ